MIPPRLRWQKRWAKPLGDCQAMRATAMRGREVQQALLRTETHSVTAGRSAVCGCAPLTARAGIRTRMGFPTGS